MRLRVILLAVAVALAGCAGPEQQTFSPRATDDLQAHAAAVRQAAQAGDADAAAAELDELRGAVQHWLDRGDIDDARADQILAAAADVESALALLAPVETPEVEETEEAEEDVEAEVEEEEDEDPDEEEEDEDNSGPGSGNGNGNDNGSSGPG